MNRRSFIAGFLVCTARCSFGLALPKAMPLPEPILVEMLDYETMTLWSYTTNDNKWVKIKEVIING